MRVVAGDLERGPIEAFVLRGRAAVKGPLGAQAGERALELLGNAGVALGALERSAGVA
jgi:hypothetical protein